MISGNNEKFNSPIRKIVGKVELSCGSSTPTTIVGNPIIITDAVPYTPIEATATICGKNLINPTQWAKASQETTLNEDVFTTNFTSGGLYVNASWLKPKTYPKGTYTLTFYPISEGAACAFFVYAAASGTLITNKYLVNADDTSFTFTANEEFYTSLAGNNSHKGTHSYKLQLEVGSSSTAYEAYQETTTALNGITTIYSSNGEAITATYQKALDGANATFTHDGDLQSIELDRTGEGKFFGYGVSQKATVKIRDKNRQYNITDNNFFTVSFDDVDVSPKLYVKDVKRDENSNNLTITGYDSIERASAHTFQEITLTSFTLGELAATIADLLGVGLVLAPESDWDEAYPDGANLNGSETLREVLNDIAEATQTIYFINYQNKLVFKRLGNEEPYNIDKSQYFTLTANPSKTLSAIVSSTELGDNIEASDGPGATQYVRDNAFWTYSENVATLVENALAAVGGTTITPFQCLWRGNYLVEIGDRIALTTKDDEIITSYMLNDKLTYTGGLKQNTQWVYQEADNEHTNPTSLGEVLKQTFAKVDKANQQIDLVVSNVDTNNEAISQLQMTTGGISSTVENIEKQINGVNNNLQTLTEKVSTQITPEAMEVEVKKQLLENGAAKVETTTGFRFDESGLTVSKSNKETETLIDEDGMTVFRDGNPVLEASNQGVLAEDLHATTFLIIGNNSRFEDYRGNRTACFWIGG